MADKKKKSPALAHGVLIATDYVVEVDGVPYAVTKETFDSTKGVHYLIKTYKQVIV